MTTPRGIRNNNPGNIDRSPSNDWKGQAADQSGDPRFCVFTTPVWGIRALAKVLMSYKRRYGIDTVQGVISRWAPSTENNTRAYVAAVAQAVGVEPDALIDLDKGAVLLPLVKAIIHHENGQQPYPDALIDDALRLAGALW